MIRRARRGSPFLALPLLLGACRSPVPCACSAPSPDPAEARAALPAAGLAPPPPAHAGAPDPAERARIARTALPDFDAPGWTRVASQSGAELVCFRPLEGAIPRNVAFDMEVWVFEDGAARPGLDVTVTAWMPDHGHGMLHAPRTQDQGDGSYLVTGMLLHMRGHWELQFNLLEGTRSEQARCSLEVK